MRFLFDTFGWTAVVSLVVLLLSHFVPVDSNIGEIAALTLVSSTLVCHLISLVESALDSAELSLSDV